MVTLNQAPGQQWFYRQIGPVFLSAGTHRLTIGRLYEGKRLDRIILTPADINWPEAGRWEVLDGAWYGFDLGRELPATTAEAVDCGSCRFRPIRLPGVRRWAWPVPEGVRAEASTDRGKTWRPVAADLADIPPPQDSEEGLTIRLTLRRAADGQSPRVPIPQVIGELDADRLALMEDSRSRVAFDRRTGGLLLMEDRLAGRSFTAGDAVGLPLGLFVKRPAEPGRWLAPSEITCTGLTLSNRTLTASYEGLHGRVLAQWTIVGQGEGLYRWQVQVRNTSEREVLRVRFPILAGLNVSGRVETDALAWPWMAGRFYQPAVRVGHQQVEYPGRAGLGFVDLYGPSGGLYLAVLEPAMNLASLEVQSDPWNGRLTLQITHHDRIRAGGQGAFHGEWAVHPGDWHWAAERYRASFQALYPRPAIPDWIRQTDGFLVRWLPRRPYSEVLRLADEAQTLGLDFIYLTHLTIGNRYYAPLPTLGGEEAIAALGRELHRRGVRWGRYFHGNSYDRFFTTADSFFGVDRSSLPEHLRPPGWDWLVRNAWYPDEHSRLDKPAPGVLTDEADIGMCFQAPSQFPEYLRFWAIDRFVRTYGLDNVYWDTLPLWSQTFVDFNPHLGHHGDARGAAARIDFLRRNIELARPANPDFVQTYEEVNDLFSLYGVGLISGFLMDDRPELYRFTHPDHLLFGGQMNGWWRSPRLEQAMDRAFVYGLCLDIVTPSDYAVEILKLRQMLHEAFERAAFKDTLGLHIQGKGVQGFVFDRGPAKGFLVTFSNPQECREAVARFDARVFGRSPASGGPALACAVEPAQLPRPIDLAVHGPTVSFPVPAGRVSAVLLYPETDPAEVLLSVKPVGAAVRRVLVFNAGRQPRRVTLPLDSRHPVVENATMQVDLPARTGQILTVALRPGQEDEPVTIRAVVDGQTVARARTFVKAAAPAR